MINNSLIKDSIGIFANNDLALYDTYSSQSCKGGIEDIMLGKFCVSLTEYSFLQKGFN